MIMDQERLIEIPEEESQPNNSSSSDDDKFSLEPYLEIGDK